MSLCSNVISQLKTLIEESGSKKKVEALSDVVIAGIDEFVKEKCFYELPTNEILKIVGKSDFKSIELICELVSRMGASKGEESTLLLNVIRRDDSTLEECIKILSKFEYSPLCQLTNGLFNEDKDLPERDIEHELEELKKEIEKLKNDKKQKKTNFPPITNKPSDFVDNIFDAIRYGHLPSIQYLFEQCHVDVNEKDRYGRTPINQAAYDGKLEIIKYFYEVCNADIEIEGDYGCTPINWAAWEGQLDVIKYLYETCHADVEAEDVYGCTPINRASENGHLEVVKYFYETCHANVETKDNYGYTPINNASLYGHLDIVKYHYETYHADVETKDNWGRTPINNASQNGYLEVVKYLYETCHANAETKDNNGRAPISWASKEGHIEVVKYLCEICHAKITEEMIEIAKTEEIKEYLRSKQSH